MENIQPEPTQLIYLKKYLALKTRCEEVQLANEKLLNRIYNVKKILKRYKKERSFLMDRLDDMGDDYQDELVPPMWEEGAEEDDTEEVDIEQDFMPTGVVVKEEKSDPVPTPFFGLEQSSVPAPESKKQRKASKAFSPYMMFCSYRRANVQQRHLEETGEEASRAELTKLLNSEWGKLTLEEKQVFQSLASKKNSAVKGPAVSPSPIKQEPIDSKEGILPPNSDLQ